VSDLHEDEGFTLCVLVHRGGVAFKRAVDTWLAAGLLEMASERLIFLQEWPEHSCELAPGAQADSKLCYQSNHMAVDDARVSDLPTQHPFQVLGQTQQQFIGPALATLARTAKHKLILFLEEDFALAPDALANQSLVKLRMHEASELLTNGQADFVKLRSRFHPGAPLYPLVWRGHEHQLLTKHTPYVSNHSVLESTHWLHHPTQVFGSDVVWPCDQQHPPQHLPKAQKFNSHASLMQDSSLANRPYCAFSTHAGYSNNPFLAYKSFLESNIAPAALVDWTKTVEAAINLSPHLWDHQCFVVAQTAGLFMHQDVDGRALEEQSPFEDPFSGDWLDRRRAAVCHGGGAQFPMCE
jgi:hypothetical protein